MTELIAIIKEKYTHGDISVDDGFFVFNNIDEKVFYDLISIELFKSAEYSSASSQGTVRYTDFGFVFEDFHELVKNVTSEDLDSKLREVFIVSHSDFFDIKDFSKNYKDWLKFFSTISDHNYPIDLHSDGRAYVIIEKSTKRSSAVLTVDIGSYSPEEIKNLIDTISDPSLLLISCSQNDAHQGEKISMMKTAIVQMIESKSFVFFDFIKHSEVILNEFHKNYETYLRSFSFESFIKDLEDDVGGFISKVEEQIQGFYIQSLAVPGAVILSSALRGAEKSISLALIFSAVLAIVIVFRSLKSKVNFIDRISKNTLAKLNVYERRTLDVSNDYAKEAIAEKIKFFKESVEETTRLSKRDIGDLRDTIIVIFVFYLIAAVIFWKF